MTASTANQKVSRREQILGTLVKMLAQTPGVPITTAALAREVGVSEAALYRHFPSKYKMFEALIDSADSALVSGINRIQSNDDSVQLKLQNILQLVLDLAAQSPGIATILAGTAITGEDERLRHKVSQVFAKLELQLKQAVRQAEISEQLRPAISMAALVSLLTSLVEGRICQFVRSGFAQAPDLYWHEQWAQLVQGLFRPSAGHQAY